MVLDERLVGGDKWVIWGVVELVEQGELVVGLRGPGGKAWVECGQGGASDGIIPCV
jgi:hypothetical protein